MSAFGGNGHAVLHCTCLLLTQSGHFKSARLLYALWCNGEVAKDRATSLLEEPQKEIGDADDEISH
jgi:hypothetical protein